MLDGVDLLGDDEVSQRGALQNNAYNIFKRAETQRQVASARPIQ
jgi:hypothetical protein